MRFDVNAPKPHYLTPESEKAHSMWEVYYYLERCFGSVSRYTSVHITSTVKCSAVPIRSGWKCARISVLRSNDVLCIHCANNALRSFWCALSMLIACLRALSPAHFPEHCSRYTSVHTCFGCVLRGRFVPRTWFDHVPAGTVLAGTILFRTRSDYKKWCVPRTCSKNMFPTANCTENKYERPESLIQMITSQS